MDSLQSSQKIDTNRGFQTLRGYLFFHLSIDINHVHFRRPKNRKKNEGTLLRDKDPDILITIVWVLWHPATKQKLMWDMRVLCGDTFVWGKNWLY